MIHYVFIYLFLDKKRVSIGDHDNDINLAHIKDKGKSSYKAKSSGYDSDDSARGTVGRRAPKSLSVQEQMVKIKILIMCLRLFCTFFLSTLCLVLDVYICVL